jgi:hypothetical protein
MLTIPFSAFQGEKVRKRGSDIGIVQAWVIFFRD